MKNPRRTELEEGVITTPRRIRSPRMDGLTMKERYQDMKIDFLKIIHLLREKLYHQQRVTQSLRSTKKIRQKSKLPPQSQPHQQNRYRKYK
jgi:hypothetical protein